jgi:Glycosyltransferase family 87
VTIRSFILSVAQRYRSPFVRSRVRGYSWILLVIGVAALAGSVLLGHYPLLAGGQPFQPDFLAHWTGGRLLLEGRAEDLYDPVVQQRLQQTALPGYHGLAWFVSPPFVAALYAPVALLPFGVAAPVWLILNTALLALAIVLALPLAEGWSRGERRLVALVFLATPAVLEVVGAGQDSVLLLVLWVAAMRLLDTRHPILAGLLVAAALFKPQLVVLVPVMLLVRRQWAAVAGLLAGTVVVVLASVAVTGPRSLAAWIDALRSPLYAQAVQQEQGWKMQSLSGLLASITSSDAAAVLLLVLAAALLAVVLIRTRSDVRADWAVLGLLTVLATPHVMLYDAVVLLPAALWVFGRPSTELMRWAAVTVVVCQLSAAEMHAVAARLGSPFALLSAPWVALPLLAVTIMAVWGRVRGEALGSLPAAHAAATVAEQ